ncbi:MAG: sulfite exporter TauE/SafE family protein [Halobacteriovoraceae bacterium]|nr:sulfite exporter TauE/SafE family protein [Halobacteriovoraceae bacterium]
MSIEILGLLFFLVAIIYSMVGFGGGSSYIAILSIAGIDYLLIPQMALVCNIVVVSGGAYNFNKKGLLSSSLLTPLLITSVPAALLGGSIPIDKITYQGILGVLLFVAGILMISTEKNLSGKDPRPGTKKGFFILGGIIGFFSGVAGIGGGIFLSPLLNLLGWQRPKNIAATASLFILVNSIFGLMGQLGKNNFQLISYNSKYLLLIVAVFLGGQIGSRISTSILSHQKVKIASACLILIVSSRLIINII